MRPLTTLLTVCCSLLFGATTSLAQMYTVTDLGTLGGRNFSYPRGGINDFGQVAGYSYPHTEDDHTRFDNHAFRTAPNSPIDPDTDDLGTLGGRLSYSLGINSFGQVVGGSSTDGVYFSHAYRTAPNKPINPATDDLGTLGGTESLAFGINLIGQAVGSASMTGDTAVHAFRTRPNRRINPKTDDLGSLGGSTSTASDVNIFGQVVGTSSLTGDTTSHAFRTRANSRINPATDDLGTLGGTISKAECINVFGQVVGTSTLPGDTTYHAFRTRPNRPINTATDDLGGLDGANDPLGLNSFGEVVGGSRAFLYSSGVMHDLNDLIPAGSGWGLSYMTGINDAGEITGQGNLNGSEGHAILLRPIYKALVQSPISADASSVFPARTKRDIPVTFILTQYDVPTCNLLPATISLTKAVGRNLTTIDSIDGASFQIDPTACQYIYNLSTARLGVGTYRVDISIEGIFVGHAVFALK